MPRKFVTRRFHYSRTTRTWALAGLVSLIAAAACVHSTTPAAEDPAQTTPQIEPEIAASADWRHYLSDPASSQSSPLAQINRTNVAQLKQAWIYHTGAKGQMQTNPLIVDGVLYGVSSRSTLFALDAATGREIWQFHPRGKRGVGAIVRGLMYWEDPAGTERRIYYAAGPMLLAVDARTGKAVRNFGEAGRVNLKDGFDRDASKLYVVATSPGVIYQDLLIIGTRVSEAHPAAPGDIRAYNLHTGKIVWAFRTIPRAGEFGSETWPPDARETFGGANCWAGMSLDTQRGVVYVPTGSAAYDFYGGDRPGENLFANCILALDAATGERLWHYQIVRHDIWDRDVPAPPNLVQLEIDGRRVDALAQITKSAHVFILDRETGRPLFEIEERPVPASDLPGEQAWPTQPIPTRPPPFARQVFTESEITNRTPEAHEAVLARLRQVRSAGQFTPPSRQGTIILPGFDGGGEWGGAAVDPETGILYVNASEMAWILTMVEIEEKGDGDPIDKGAETYTRRCALCHGSDLKGDPFGENPPLIGIFDRLGRDDFETIVRDGKGEMPAFDYLTKSEFENLVAYVEQAEKAELMESDLPDGDSTDGDAAGGDSVDVDSANTFMQSDRKFRSTGYNRFLDPDGYPALSPPWGTLTAIDLNRAELLWQVALGEVPELTRSGIAPTGTENYGGPIVTAGGLIFIGATRDEMLRAFDKDTGEILWQTRLPAGGYATPATYAVDGRQYIVIAAGGRKMGTDAGDAYVAFALPEGATDATGDQARLAAP